MFSWLKKPKVANPAGVTVTMQAPPAKVQMAGANLASLRQGRYQITGLLGQGGMAKVYLAETIGKQKVAIKELDTADQKLIDMFVREKDIVKSIKDDHFPGFIDYFVENSRHYLVMEFIDGQNLEELLNSNGVFTEEKTIDIGLQVLEALQILHERKLIYRDLKPRNIILTAQGKTKLIDFGIAREETEKDQRGTMIGTPGYAPPEQYSGKAEFRSDLYALGKTMYALLTNFDVNLSGFDLDPIRQIRSDVSKKIEAFIIKATQLDFKHRYGSAAEMKKELAKLMAALSHQVPMIWWMKWKWDNCVHNRNFSINWHKMGENIIYFAFSLLLMVGLLTFTPEMAIIGSSGMVFVLIAMRKGICPTCLVLNLTRVVIFLPLNLLILAGNLVLVTLHYLGQSGRQIIKWIKGWPWGTRRDAKRFMLTPWPHVVHLTTWFTLWVIGKTVYFATWNWFWITFIGLSLCCLLLFFQLLAVGEINDSNDFGAFVIVPHILSLAVAGLVWVIVYEGCGYRDAYYQEKVNILFESKEAPILVNEPVECHWQVRGIEADHCWLIFQDSGKRIALKEADNDGELELTFTKPKKYLVRLLVIDKKRRLSADQFFEFDAVADQLEEKEKLKIKI